jgi:hypothetical protein
VISNYFPYAPKATVPSYSPSPDTTSQHPAASTSTSLSSNTIPVSPSAVFTHPEPVNPMSHPSS